MLNLGINSRNCPHFSVHLWRIFYETSNCFSNFPASSCAIYSTNDRKLFIFFSQAIQKLWLLVRTGKGYLRKVADSIDLQLLFDSTIPFPRWPLWSFLNRLGWTAFIWVSTRCSSFKLVSNTSDGECSTSIDCHFFSSFYPNPKFAWLFWPFMITGCLLCHKWWDMLHQLMKLLVMRQCL